MITKRSMLRYYCNDCKCKKYCNNSTQYCLTRRIDFQSMVIALVVRKTITLSVFNEWSRENGSAQLRKKLFGYEYIIRKLR